MKYLGKPCKRGHDGWRYTKSGYCVACQALKRKEWAEKHPDRMDDARQRWLSANPDKAKEAKKLWKQSNPDAVRLSKRVTESRRRVRAMEAGGKHTIQQLLELLFKQKHRCAICRCKLTEYHVDHVMPLAKGGGNGIDNLQILCPPCNRSKNDKDPIEFMQSRGFLL